MYGGKLHRVTGDIKDNMTGKCLYKIDGEWNGKLKFTDESNVSLTMVTMRVTVIVTMVTVSIKYNNRNVIIKM